MPSGPTRVTTDPGSRGTVLLLHGGMSDEAPWQPVAAALEQRFRVALIRRRLYRLDLPVDPLTAMADQVTEVLDTARGSGRPCVVVGHSSGAIVALEALSAEPELFAGGVLYEPPSPLDGLPLAAPTTVRRARDALARRHPGRALQIFLREAVQLPWSVSSLAPVMTLIPGVRRYVARQIDDLDSIVRLGVRTEVYGRIELPVWFLTGERSPRHLGERCTRLAETLPSAELVT
ncbi:MAG TPA: alpha/beta hydrolase, partial [Microlunatus sp.]|nr:alpha/beta hydrolase [Microlunatus sp.]